MSFVSAACIRPFSYSELWADLVVAQLRQLGSDPMTWGYACLCVGPEFDKFIEGHYEALDIATGDFLHIFSMSPAPYGFMLGRIAEAEKKGEHELAKHFKRHLPFFPERHNAERQKAQLIADLRRAGLTTTEATDFLFFDFSVVQGSDDTSCARKEDAIDIHVIAAKAAPVEVTRDQTAAFEFFRRLGSVATKCALERLPATGFVEQASLHWAHKIALRKSLRTFSLVREFLQRIKPNS